MYSRVWIKAGYDVTVLCWDRECKHPEHEIIEGIIIERVSIPSWYGRGSSQMRYLLRFWLRAYKRALALKPHVIHAHDFNTLPLGYLLAKRLDISIIFDAHESYSEMLADNVHPFLKRAIATAERFFIRRVNWLITVGTLLEKEYQQRGARNTKVIGNWKRPQEFRFSWKQIRTVRDDLGIPQDSLVICYLGYFERSRGLLPLLEAVSSDQRLVLVIGGKGTLEKNIAAACKEARNIVYLGYTPPDYIPIFTAVSDVIYYGLENGFGNNRYSTPNKLFEALAAGKAVLSGNHGEIAKIVKEERCGITLSSIDKETLLAAIDIFRDERVLSAYKKNARTAALKTYNWEKAERDLLGIYENELCLKQKCDSFGM
jgi:glycosyltransferase involved in cell wall biosynthesis